MSAPGPPAYLATLNAQQRRAVEHGCGNINEAAPLLIIAGAGSGKTNTLANRVAHLIASGADPRRMMLLTFSRRAAVEMQRRVERITAQALGDKGGAVGPTRSGLAPSTPSALASFGSTFTISAWMAPLRFTIAKIRPTS